MKPRDRQPVRGRKSARQGLKPGESAGFSARLKSCPDTKQQTISGEIAQARPIGTRKTVQIEKPVYGGSFLARIEGKAVFVPLALSGEQARIRIVEEKRGYASAEIEEIVSAAPGRTAPACRHFGACGGCNYQQADYAVQLAFKQVILRETLERAGVRAPDEIAVLAAEPWAYRNRIRLAFDAQGNPGYRSRRSHAIVPIAECPIAAPLLVRAALTAADLARELTPSLGPTGLSLFCDADESAFLASVFTSSAVRIGFDQFAQALHKRIPELTGAELILETHANERPRTLARWGATSLTYRAAGFDYRVDQSAFFQVNRRLIDALVERVTAGRSGALAWDLFAGVGLFARRLAAKFARVIAVESAPAATAALAHNLTGTNATAVTADALAFLRRSANYARPDLIVVDPPRTGLGPPIAEQLARIAVPTLVYVSCDPATLARDLRALTASGYAIHSVTLADLFPQTFHLETVVELLKS
ncbi:MAG: class I SAM-dependent RNA methyltransferase [Terracidiphilus sp.]